MSSGVVGHVERVVDHVERVVGHVERSRDTLPDSARRDGLYLVAESTYGRGINDPGPDTVPLEQPVIPPP